MASRRADCEQCGKLLEGKQRRVCSATCRRALRTPAQAPRLHTCVACGQTFEHRQGGVKYCSPGCRQDVYRRNHKPRRKTSAREATCLQCDLAFTTRDKHQRYCSVACSNQAHGPSKRKIVRTHRCAGPCSRQIPLARYRCRRCASVRRYEREQRRRATQTRTWTAGPCNHCGTNCVVRAHLDSARYCSDICSRRSHKERRRAAKRNAYVEDVHRLKVYERDCWRCQLCGCKVRRDAAVPHPRAPTIDHIVPLAAGGEHSYLNTQLACFLCNARKGDRAGGQLRLVA